MSPLERYAALLRSLPDKQVPHPKQPVILSLSEHLGAPSGFSVDAASLLTWATSEGKLSASVQWKLRETFAAWDAEKPSRSQVAVLIEWLAHEIKASPLP